MFWDTFVGWLLRAVAIRQDRHGAQVPRGRRMVRKGWPVLIQTYNIRTLRESAPDSVGICWQPRDRRVHGTDLLWRCALAWMALRHTSCSKTKGYRKTIRLYCG